MNTSEYQPNTHTRHSMVYPWNLLVRVRKLAGDPTHKAWDDGIFFRWKSALSMMMLLSVFILLSACQASKFHKVDALVEPFIPDMPKSPYSDGPRIMPQLTPYHQNVKEWYGKPPALQRTSVGLMVVVHPPMQRADAAAFADAYCIEHKLGRVWMAETPVKLNEDVSSGYGFECR